MKIFVAGGTGFVGSRLVQILCEDGHDITCLARSREGLKIPSGVEILFGDALSPSGLSETLKNFDAVINLIGIIREHPAQKITFKRLHLNTTQNLVKAARDAGVKRFLQMSANGARASGTGYQETKYEAEEFLKNSGLQWTIFRPSLIFGPPPEGRTEFCTQIGGLLKLAPAVPVFNGGDYLFQPIHVDDVGRCFANGLANPSVVGRTLHLGGNETVSYRRMLDLICEGIGIKKRIKIPVPWVLARPFVALLGRLPFFPATADQIDMLIEGNCIPESDFEKLLELTPQSFCAENLSYLRK